MAPLWKWGQHQPCGCPAHSQRATESKPTKQHSPCLLCPKEQQFHKLSSSCRRLQKLLFGTGHANTAHPLHGTHSPGTGSEGTDSLYPIPHTLSLCFPSEQWLACAEFQDTLKNPAVYQVLKQASFKGVLESFCFFAFLPPSPSTDTE